MYTFKKNNNLTIPNKIKKKKIILIMMMTLQKFQNPRM